MIPTAHRLKGLTLSALLLVSCSGWVQAHPGSSQTPALPQGLLENRPVELPPAGGEILLTLNKGKPDTGVMVVRVKKAANVLIKVNSNSAEELHLHGYDLRLPVSQNTISELRFQALKTGRFEMESHLTHRPVLILEVRP